jgi:uncharacterized protein YaiI (UPF0178 family)
MTEIYVDADACPVKQEILRVAARHGLVVHLVGNTWMRVGMRAGGTPGDDPNVRRVVVAGDSDAADDWIAERIGAADITVTQDIPLAARCLEKGARAIGPTGKPFTKDNIGMALAMRDLNSHLRDSGEIRGGGPAFSAKDRSRFLQALEETIRSIQRTGA